MASDIFLRGFDWLNQQAAKIPGTSQLAGLAQQGRTGLENWVAASAPQPGDVPGIGSRGDVQQSRQAVLNAYDFLVPQSEFDIATAALPLGWVRRVGDIPTNKLKRFAMREGVPREEMTEALGSEVGRRFKPTKTGRWEDTVSGGLYSEQELLEMFDQDTLVRADILPYTPAPLEARSATVPTYEMERQTFLPTERRPTTQRAPGSNRDVIREDSAPEVNESTLMNEADRAAGRPYYSETGVLTGQQGGDYFSTDTARQAEDIEQHTLDEILEAYSGEADEIPEYLDAIRRLEPGQGVLINTNIVYRPRPDGSYDMIDDPGLDAGVQRWIERMESASQSRQRPSILDDVTDDEVRGALEEATPVSSYTDMADEVLTGRSITPDIYDYELSIAQALELPDEVDIVDGITDYLARNQGNSDAAIELAQAVGIPPEEFHEYYEIGLARRQRSQIESSTPLRSEDIFTPSRRR